MVDRKALVKRLWFPAAILIGIPLLFFGKIGACIFTLWLCSSFLIIDVIPTGITTMIPLFVFPTFGVVSANDLAGEYFKDGTVLFLTSYIMALAIEETNAHRRVALSLLRLSGPKRPLMLFYFTVATTVISCFISDSAATAVMILIAKAIMETLTQNNMRTGDDSDVEITENESSLNLNDMNIEDKNFCKALILSSAYAGLIGGTGLLTGTSANLLLNVMMKKSYPHQDDITFVQWMKFSLPFIPIYTLAIYLIILFMCLGLRAAFRPKNEEENKKNEAMTEQIRKLYEQLGSFTFAELSVYFWFGILILMWIFRDPGFTTGWTAFLPFEGKNVSDATISILIVTILFVWPRDPFNDRKLVPIMTWDVMAQKFCWNFILLFGMGVSLARGVEDSGISKAIACWAQEKTLGAPPILLQAVIFGVQCILKEFGVSAFLIPIALSISKSAGLHPFYIGLPGTLSISYGFCLPTYIGIILAMNTKLVSLRDTIPVGFIVKIACYFITILNFNTYAYWLFDMKTVQNIQGGANLFNCT